MVNNSSNINKVDNHLSPQTFNTKRPTFVDGNLGPDFGQVQKCGN